MVILELLPEGVSRDAAAGVMGDDAAVLMTGTLAGVIEGVGLKGVAEGGRDEEFASCGGATSYLVAVVMGARARGFCLPGDVEVASLGACAVDGGCC